MRFLLKHEGTYKVFKFSFKPILFTEVGYRSIQDARHHPFDSGINAPESQKEQEILYDLLFSYCFDYPVNAKISA